MDINLDSREQQVVDTAKEFSREMVVPHAAGWELERKVPLDTLRAAAAAGLMGLRVAEKYGGKGLSATATARIMEEIASGCMYFAFSLVVHNNLAGNICDNGTPEQIQQFVPSLIKGEHIGAFCLTEPEAGSDAAAITTEAKAVDGGWILNGERPGSPMGQWLIYSACMLRPILLSGGRALCAFWWRTMRPGLRRGTSTACSVVMPWGRLK